MPKSIPTMLALLLTMAAISPAEAAPRRDPGSLDLGHAHQSLSKGGPSLKMLYSPAAGTFNYMAGGRGVGYVAESFYLGGAGFGSTSAMGYGGFLAGFEGKLDSDHGFDLSLLVGGGGGNGSGAGFAIEPEASYSRSFGGGYRGTVSLGYLFMPSAPNNSGVALGLRLEFKSLSLSLPVDD